MNSGTLVVCSALTLNASSFNGGAAIVIELGGSLTINNAGTINPPIVNYGSLTIKAPTTSSVVILNGSMWNYGSETTMGSLTFDPSGPYNMSTTSSMVISGDLVTNSNMVNNGTITVAGLYTAQNAICLGDGAVLGLHNFYYDASADGVTVPAGTATIGVTGTFNSNWNQLTATNKLTFCEGPAETNGGGQGNPASAIVHTNCALTALPVTLVSFSAEAQNNICELQWITTQQRGSVNFDIEYSTDAVNYQTLAILPAVQGTNSYSYMTPVKANTWFRLRMVNEDSSYSYSEVVPVTYQAGRGDDMYILLIQPNLITGNTLQVWSNMSSAQSGEWRVVDMMGRTMMRQAVQLNAGTTRTALQLPALFSGMYRLLFMGSQVRPAPVPFSVMR